MTTLITRSHVEKTLAYIVLSGCGLTFADWLALIRVNTSRLSDHLVLDLKFDNTLPETFESFDEFRSYLQSQHACPAALRLAPKVWGRYRRWARKAVQS